MNEKLISDTLVKAILSCLERRIDIPNEYVNAFIARTMLVVQKEDRKQISTLYPRLCDSVFAYFRGHQYNENYMQETNPNDIHAVYEKPNNRAFVFKMGELHACITILNDVIRKLDENEEAIANTAYFVKNIVFFETIANKPGIKHSDLARLVGKSPSSLSQFVLKIQQYDLFTQTVVGREKYYSLTSKGLALLNNLEVNEKEEKSEDHSVASKPAASSVRTVVFEHSKPLSKYYMTDEFVIMKRLVSFKGYMIDTVEKQVNQSSNHPSNLEINIDKITEAYSDAYKDQEIYKPDETFLQMYQ